jgi:hypothetical protein
MRLKLLGAAIAAVVMSVPASAAQFVDSYSFTADNVVRFGFGGPAPYNNISGTFTVLIDDFAKTAVLQALSLTVGPTSFDANNSAAVVSGNRLIIGEGNPTASLDLTGTREDFNISFRIADAGDGEFTYTATGFPGRSFTDSNPTITLLSRQVISAIPEPATWAMMLVGFGAVGYSMRKRTRIKYSLA